MRAALSQRTVSDHQTKRKVDSEDYFSGFSFLLPNEAETLLNSHGRVPPADPVTVSDCTCEGEVAEPDDRGYLS